MLTMLLAATAMDFTPTDDIWVYPHASDPKKDAYLRVWGTQGQAVVDNESVESVSYSYLRFDLSRLPADKKIKSARLVVTHAAGATFDLETAKKNPLEARPLANGFDEKTWNYEQVGKLAPGAKVADIFGSASPASVDPESEFKIEIDLLKGPADFRVHAKGTIGVALTSTMPVETGRAMYKVFSKDAERASARPVLWIEVE